MRVRSPPKALEKNFEPMNPRITSIPQFSSHKCLLRRVWGRSVDAETLFLMQHCMFARSFGRFAVRSYSKQSAL